jgi:Flp pilus assembly protein TadD
VVTWLFPLISKTIVSMIVLTLIAACSSRRSDEQTFQDGAIAHPFLAQTHPIGQDPPKSDRMIIRSTVGNQEYMIEIPEGAQDYDIEIPFTGDGSDGAAASRSGTPNPQLTDAELLAALPRHDAADSQDSALLNKGLSLAPDQSQGPSYTLGLARVNELYVQNQFELALIEVNQLLSYYPNSSQLFKMKGTLLMKMQNQTLALQAWRNALQLDPNDARLRRVLESLSKDVSQ